MFENIFARDRDLKPGNRGFKAGPTSNNKSVNAEQVTPPLRSGRQKFIRRNW